jgi:hypothetical protein
MCICQKLKQARRSQAKSTFPKVIKGTGTKERESKNENTLLSILFDDNNS